MRYGLALAAMAIACAPAFAQSPTSNPAQVAEAALHAAPVWDGHNDMPGELRDRRRNMIANFDFRDTTNTAEPLKDRHAMHTDLPRLRQGRVGAQFWSVYVSASLTEQQAVQAVLEQIDVTKRLVARHPREMQLAASSAEVEAAMRAGRIASLLGMEGGHSIGSSLAVLRQMHALGVRYMTLVHSKNSLWADSATDTAKHDGLTDFGRDVVREMQRIGMLVDLSHASEATMLDTLDVAKAPVIFSHSSALSIVSHPRNVPDTVLDRLKANGGIVMVVTVPRFVSDEVRVWTAASDGETARLAAMNIGDPKGAECDKHEWTHDNPEPRSTIAQLADHIDHVVKRAGIDHVGIGADFDGMPSTTEGLDDVSGYPALFTELARRGYGQADLEKIASRNMMRVLKAAEAHAAARKGDPPIENPTVF